jgi:putative heme-binding domain-containing protein
MRVPIFSVSTLLALVISTSAQNNLTQIPPTDPADQVASFRLAEGMEINLFATEPLVRKPIQMSWDSQGRLWVASSAIYPHIKPGQEESDQILILEDENQDGKADKSTVFFEGLLIPTGILPYEDGVFVANSTEVIFLRDTDKDGKADSREVLLSGFGTEDTHHIIHSFKLGHDGCVYFNQSVYIHSHVETPFGVRRLSGSGVWQYQPKTKRLEVFSMGHVNPWGHVFDDWGQSFITDGAYGEGINHNFPGATFRCLPNQLPRILRGLNLGQPKQCGLEIVNGTQFPDDWQGQLITCDFRGHRVNRFALTENGSGFTSKQLPDLVSSTHAAFRPVDVNHGPDGAIYLADWYNPIIQHGEVDFRDSRRDRVHGRIWRVSAKGRETSKRIDFPSLTPDALIGLLKSRDQSVRLYVKQELKRRNLPDLAKILTAQVKEATASDALFLADVLWTAQTCGCGDAIFTEILRHPAHAAQPRLRGICVRYARETVVHRGAAALAPWPDLISSACHDASPIVRLEAVNLLREIATPKVVEQALQVMDYPLDTNLDYSLWLTCYKLSSTWLPAYKNGEITFAAKPDRILFALSCTNDENASSILLSLLEQKQTDEKQAIQLFDVICKKLTAASANSILAVANTPAKSPALRLAALRALASSSNINKCRPADLSQLEALLSQSPDLAAAAAQLAGLWKVESLRGALESYARKTGSMAHSSRMALARLGKSKPILAEIYAAQPQPAERTASLLALLEADLHSAIPLLIEHLASLTASDESSAMLFDALLRRKNSPALFAKSLEGKKIHADIASQALQKTSTTGGDTSSLMAALTKSGNLQPITSLSPTALQELVAEVATKGSAARGESIYRKSALQCINCHALGSAGGIIGPDLVSLGASAPVDYIVESLIEPGKKIKEGYATAMIQTKDGGNHTGFLAREDDREIFIRDSLGVTKSFPRDQVTKKEVIPVSLMPAGLTASLRRDEFIDLVRFLSELGKEGSYKIQEDGVIRQWQSCSSVESDTWLPLTTFVDGKLHYSEASVVTISSIPRNLVRSTIEVFEDGPVRIASDVVNATRMEIDGKQVFPREGIVEVPLTKGRHILLLNTASPSQETPRIRILSANARAASE